GRRARAAGGGARRCTTGTSGGCGNAGSAGEGGGACRRRDGAPVGKAHGGGGRSPRGRAGGPAPARPRRRRHRRAALGARARARAGRAGARLAAVRAGEVPRRPLVRILTALPEPAAGPVRVLGIDAFALRTGSEYATLLVDMETGLPVDVLPDRQAG